MSKSQKDGFILFGIGLVALVIVLTVLHFAILMHTSKVELEGWTSDNITAAVLALAVCAWVAVLAIVAIVGGMEEYFQRSFVPSWLSMRQKPATVDAPLEPAVLREKVMSIVAKALGVHVAEITEETKIGPNLYKITPTLAMAIGKTVHAEQETTVGELLEQLA